jgi:2-polyprenyl-6-methoxyphenol hydroxylase-like FAD-dependent oxidoreductase
MGASKAVPKVPEWERIVTEMKIVAERPVLLRALADFAQARRADRALTITATDLIARVTAIDNPLAAAIRGFGLSALDLLPQLRRRALQVMVFGAA